MKTTWQRLLVLCVLSTGLVRCFSSSSGGSTTCNAFSQAEPNAACGTCVESECASQITAASAPCADFVTCMCASGGTADSCASKLQEVSCQPASQALATCAESKCTTQCAGVDASALGDSSSGSQPESGVDGTVESSVEAGVDATFDSSSNGDSSGSSSGGEAGEEDGSTTDAFVAEAAVEAAVEAGVEASVDAGTDASDAGGCTTGQTSCSGTCTNTTTDNNNCGTCGTVCGGGESCAASTCTCPGTQTFCNATCTDTTIDNSNCGKCGNVCTNGAVCAGGTCGTVCKAPSTTCSGTCTNTQIDPANCGNCGNACGPNQNAIPGCDQGACVYGCNQGFLDCTSQTGCEVNGQIDLKNCGACNAVCGAGNDAPACAAGVCSLNCNAGFKSCDGLNSNGCEDNTAQDVNNCGICGKSCPGGFTNATRACAASACTFTCTGTFQDCDSSKTGCDSNSQTDPANCGSCGKACPDNGKPASGTTPTCAAATCGFTCNAPWADCDMDPKNGCEHNTSADLQNCGACGAVCGMSEQDDGGTNSPVCAAGVCTLNCAPGWSNCNGSNADGCEDQTSNDPANCGTCGTKCPNTAPFCSQGTCYNPIIIQ